MKTDFTILVMQLAEILRGTSGNYYTRYRDSGELYIVPPQTCPPREWHRDLQRRFNMHPAIIKALASDHRPYDWHLLVLEWPHVSETDSTRLAYTRDERSALADRQVITTVGKYLTRHFTTMPDHEIRNLVALYAAGDSCKFVHTMDEMLRYLMDGPNSCMNKDITVRCSDGKRRHPYEVYDPQYGWHMAVRITNSETVGRALCMDNGEDKYFVRSYRKTDNYSPADEQLEAWLESQGYKKQSSYFSGEKLAHYTVNRDEILAPYIDGNRQWVYVYDNDTLTIDSDGTYCCDQTGGIVGEGDSSDCEDCGDRVREGDGYWVGRGEDRMVCQHCCDNHYFYAYGRNGGQYYVHEDDITEVNGEYYDSNYLSDNEIVMLHDGEYEHMDSAAYIESSDEWYHCDDEDICYAEDSNQYELKDDCWQCAESDKWYTTGTENVEIDGETYHPDHAPEQETEQTTDEE